MRIRFQKKHLTAQMAALFAAVALFLTVFAVPVPAAAPLQMDWYNGAQETEISVEVGAKFYVGDFVRIYSADTAATASLVKASYQIKGKKVATVNSRGYLNAKKDGTTDLIVFYRGKKVTAKLTVVKKGTFEKNNSITELKKAASKLAKGMPKKLTASKGYALKKKRDAYMVSYGSNASSKLSYDGFLYEHERPSRDPADYLRTEQLAVPEAGRYLTAEALLRQFLLTNNPTDVNAKKVMRVASASANSKTGKISVTLKKKLSAEQIFAAQLAFPRENGQSLSKTKAGILLSIFDETARKYYKGQITLKKGSRQLDVKLVTSGYGGYKPAEIIKGHVYLLGSQANWAGGVKMKAK